jgi:lipoprotein-anchoring transpeptidase ErfK/SrfK
VDIERPDTIWTMTDYYSILRKAVADRHRPSEAERHEIYQHARRTVVSQLRAADPPWPDADVDRQVEALDAAIARLESEIEDEHGSPPPPERASQDDQRFERALPSPDGEPVAAPGRRARWAILGASAALLLTGLGAYWLVARDPDVAPTPAGPAEPVRSAAVEPQRQADAAADAPQASYMLRKQHVYYRTTHPPGTVMISRNQKFLYVVQPNQVAIRYAIGVGPDCVEVSGLFHITDKVNRVGKGEAQPGGSATSRKGDVEPRLGARIIYFGDRHAVHGTTEPSRIGESASFGCFHQWNQDIVDLYNRVALNERVVVAN